MYRFSTGGGTALFDKCAAYTEEKNELKLWSEVALNDAMKDVIFRARPRRAGGWRSITLMIWRRRSCSLSNVMTDYFENAAELTGKKRWLFDMNGTVYEVDTLVDGAIELLMLCAKMTEIMCL